MARYVCWLSEDLVQALDPADPAPGFRLVSIAPLDAMRQAHMLLFEDAKDEDPRYFYVLAPTIRTSDLLKVRIFLMEAEMVLTTEADLRARLGRISDRERNWLFRRGEFAECDPDTPDRPQVLPGERPADPGRETHAEDRSARLGYRDGEGST